MPVNASHQETGKPVIFLKIREVAVIAGFCRSKIYSLIKAGEFPKPVKIGRSSRWRSDRVHEWQEGVPISDL